MAHGNKNAAVYAGTFDPITLGHLDIVDRGLHIFDKMYVAVAEDIKPGGVFTTEERIQLVKDSVREFGDRVGVQGLSGLLVDHARNLGVKVVVRGLRAVSDYEYESQMAMTNRRLAPEIETIFLMTSWKYSFISSSTVREIARNKGELSFMVPPVVEVSLRDKFSCQ
jgi:pantetheine-phosphate adenylyltransferase